MRITERLAEVRQTFDQRIESAKASITEQVRSMNLKKNGMLGLQTLLLSGACAIPFFGMWVGATVISIMIMTTERLVGMGISATIAIGTAAIIAFALLNLYVPIAAAVVALPLSWMMMKRFQEFHQEIPAFVETESEANAA